MEGFMEVELMVTKRDDDDDDDRRQGEYRAICLWNMDWQSFAIFFKKKKISLPPPLERARCRDIGLPPTWSITTRETDSTHISQLKTPHPAHRGQVGEGAGATRGWTESWQGAERKELR